MMFLWYLMLLFFGTELETQVCWRPFFSSVHMQTLLHVIVFSRHIPRHSEICLKSFTSWYIIISNVVLCTSRYVIVTIMIRYVILRHGTLYYVILYHVVSCCDVSCPRMFRCIILACDIYISYQYMYANIVKLTKSMLHCDTTRCLYVTTEWFKIHSLYNLSSFHYYQDLVFIFIIILTYTPVPIR